MLLEALKHTPQLYMYLIYVTRGIETDPSTIMHAGQLSRSHAYA